MTVFKTIARVPAQIREFGAALAFAGILASPTGGSEISVTSAVFGVVPERVICRNLSTGETAAGAPESPTTRCSDLGLEMAEDDLVRVELRGTVPQPSGTFVSPMFMPRLITEDDDLGRAIGDLDADGDLDIVRGTLWEMLENSGDPQPVFTSILLEEITGIFDPHLVDLDENGTLDIVTRGRMITEELRWFPNLGGSPPAFDVVRVEKREGFEFRDPVSIDVDGDGDLDLASRVENFGAPGLFEETAWYERDGETFTRHTIYETRVFHEMRPLDFDNDGDGDFIIVDRSDIEIHQLLLLRNIGGEPPAFESHVLDEGDLSSQIRKLDFDLDGDVDFLLAPTIVNDYQAILYENVSFTFPFFERHVIGEFEDGSGSAVGDFDGNGLPDLVLTRQNTERGDVSWLRNLGTTPPTFEEHAIAIRPRLLSPSVGDLDGDSDLDVLGESTEELYWLEQMDAFGASAAGLSSRRVSCRNLRTDQEVRQVLGDRFTWNCEALGLVVLPGDPVATVFWGIVEPW